MESFSLIGTVFVAHLFALASPGPDFFMVIKNSTLYSRKTGFLTSIGFGLGLCVHILYCVFGIAFLISQSSFIFTCIKLLGAAYLFYIGFNSFISKKTNIRIEDKKKIDDISTLSAIKVGFLTNVLNPKATLFFLSLFTFILKPTTPNWVILCISVLMVSSTIIWFSLVCIFFTQKKIQKLFDKFSLIFNKFFGLLLIGIAVQIAFFTSF